jgi:hypothetical protein
MSKKAERIRRMVADPAFIAGIHNYCDRWCQRCSMTSRCSVFAMEQTESESCGDLEREDIGAQLIDILEATAAMLQEMAEEMGIDLDQIPEDEADDQGRDEGRDHILVRSAMKYADGVRGWFDLWGGRLAEIGVIGGSESRSELRVVGSGGKAAPARDLVEVILWYQPLIHAKLYRAVIGDETLDGMENFPRDADGSAKVALIAIERSTAAWSGLMKQFPQAGSDILDFLYQLERLRRATEWSFPNARAFVRPGFDDDAGEG